MSRGKNTEGLSLQCYHEDCLYQWFYNGNSTIYATCPGCRRGVKIEKAYNGV